MKTTTLSTLKPGDTFYRAGDRNREMLEYYKQDANNPNRIICVPVGTPNNERHHVHLQKWLKPSQPVVAQTAQMQKAAGIMAALWIMFFVFTTATGQPVFNVGANFSSKDLGPGGTIEAGGRIGPMLYTGAQLSAYSHGYPTMTGSALIGAAFSWNNNKMHELTTVWYAKAELAIIADDDFKADPPSPFGFGVRHYVYNAFVDIGYQPKQIVLTIGYSFGKIYK
jgi:hypothetical protein